MTFDFEFKPLRRYVCWTNELEGKTPKDNVQNKAVVEPLYVFMYIYILMVNSGRRTAVYVYIDIYMCGEQRF